MNEVKDKSAEMKQLTGLLVGDELGIIRRLELDNQAQTARTRTINREILERPSPEHAILAICRFDRVNQTSPGFQHQNRQHLLLITSRNRKLHLYDSIADRLHSFEANRTDGQIVGAAPFATNHIVVCYADGAIHIQNVEREMILIGADKEGNTKALKVLGIEDKGIISSSSSSALH